MTSNVVSGDGIGSVSAFLCADLALAAVGLRRRPPQYIASWLEVLKNHKRCIEQAASDAKKAVDFLHRLQSGTKAEAA